MLLFQICEPDATAPGFDCCHFFQIDFRCGECWWRCLHTRPLASLRWLWRSLREWNLCLLSRLLMWCMFRWIRSCLISSIAKRRALHWPWVCSLRSLNWFLFSHLDGGNCLNVSFGGGDCITNVNGCNSSGTCTVGSNQVRFCQCFDGNVCQDCSLTVAEYLARNSMSAFHSSAICFLFTL
jgi:hypothetical protein